MPMRIYARLTRHRMPAWQGAYARDPAGSLSIRALSSREGEKSRPWAAVKQAQCQQNCEDFRAIARLHRQLRWHLATLVAT